MEKTASTSWIAKEHPTEFAAPKTCEYLREVITGGPFDQELFWSTFERDLQLVQLEGRVGWDAVLMNSTHPCPRHPRMDKPWGRLTVELSIENSEVTALVLLTYYQAGAEIIDYCLRIGLAFATDWNIGIGLFCMEHK
jgi:hypothetical protein